MNKIKINKEKILESVVKLVSDKEIVRSYIKGKITKNSLSKKGIKLAKPL